MSNDPVQIGRYRILGALGQGAMGAVYLAEDPLLKRGVAIKVVRGGMGSEEALARFQREAEISARLNHPSVITIFDVGEEPHMGPFMAMEFVEGESLSDLIKAGPIDPGRTLALLLQAADALQAAHNLGIIHRDIKPGNFMVTLDGRLKLMDFGIARRDEKRLTTTAAFMGTPGYASPEGLSGNSRADESTDRWAFSVTAFEMLTGHLPFEGDSVGAVLYRVVHEPPSLPDTLSPGLKAVFAQALAKNPAFRYSSLQTFLQALVEALPLEESMRDQFRSQLEALNLGTGSFRMLPPVPMAGSRRKPWLIVGATAALCFLLWFLWSRSQATRTLSIESQPTGAGVSLDGSSLGRTPLPKAEVPERGRLLRLEKADYLPLEYGLKPEDRRLNLKLLPAPFQVSVVSEPAGAEVLLDGASKGSAPLESLEIPGEGIHTLQVRMDGYQSYNAQLHRHLPLPNPIRLQKRGSGPGPVQEKPKPGKVKKFFKGIFGK